jgi:serine/threonine protein kinase
VSLYRRKIDGVEIVTKEIPNFDSDGSLECLEMLTHLKNPSIFPLFGIVSPTNSTNLTIATLYYRNGSLKEVLANPPSWWTPTAKSKTIAAIVVGMRFAHSLGCAHGSLKPSNILFTEKEHVQIVDFCSNHLQGRVRNEADDESKALLMDVVAFCSILFEIVVGRSVVAQISPYHEFKIELVDNGEQVEIPSLIPSFMRFLFAHRSFQHSFREIYEALKRNYFNIIEGNDVDEVLRFVSSLEASEYEGE